MNERQDRPRGNVGDEVREGIRAGIGILSALKEAIEDTVQDMTDRGELSQERARETVRTMMDRTQAAFDDARVKLDFVPRQEFEALKAEVADLRARLARHESRHPAPGEATGGDAAGGDEPGAGTGTDRPFDGGDIPITES